MAVTPRKLSLTRDQFSSFLQDFEQIKQFENLFATVDTIANVTLDDINIAAGNAGESANDALAQIIALSDTLNKEPNPATVSQLAVIETQLAALNVAPPASLGTVTSVAASGGTTGLTFSGSPITTSGTLTLGGVLGIANGGTNSTATPTAGGLAYGTGTAYAFSSPGAAGQFLTSTGGSTPTWSTISTPSIGQSSYYGSFYDTTATQVAANTTTAYAIQIGQTAENNGVTIASGDEITFAHSGVYNVQYSIQFTNTDNAIHNVNIWLRKNGVDVADSNSQYAVIAKHGSIHGQLIAAVNYVLTVTAGDYLQLMWQTEGVQAFIETIPAGTTPTTPVTPGVIVTVCNLPDAGIGYAGLTSTTSMAISTGSKSFTVSINSANSAFVVGNRVRLIYDATNYMEGTVTAYSGTSMTVNVDTTAGSGTYAAWTIGLTGVVNTGVTSFSGGSTGLTPATATSGVVALGGTLAVANGGTGQTSYTDGQLLIGNTTGNTLNAATLTPGSGVSITNGAGAITISATGSGGTVTSVSVVSANGFAGTVATATTTPAITLSTSVTGLIKGNGTALSAAVAATDYVAPSAYASANGLTMATSRLLGRTTASTGAAEEISVAGGLTLSGGVLTGASGTVTSVTGTAPVVSSGGSTPAISMAAATTSVNGYLTSTDWNTFNNKGSGTVTSVAALTLGTTGTDLSSTVANGTTTPVITLQVPTASATNRGALSAADWTTFNSKGSGSVTSVSGTGTVNGITLTGTVTTSGSLTLGGTLSGVNLTSQVTGVLPVANGGTGTSTAFTTGSIVFAGTSGVYSQDNTNLFWDDANNRLGVGTSTPGATIDVAGNIRMSAGSPNIELNNGGPMVYAPVGNTLSFATGGGPSAPQEKFRIGSSGQWGIGGATYGTSGQVFTSGGSGAAPTWTTPTTGTVTSVGGTGTVNGITLTGTVTSSGSLTLGGTLSGVSLTTQVSGTLPVGNGGTGATTITSGRLVKANGASAFSAALVYDTGTNSGIVSGNFIIDAGSLQTKANGSTALANALNDNLVITVGTGFMTFTGGGAFAQLGGMVAGSDGQRLVILNTTGGGVVVIGESGTSTAANRIWTQGLAPATWNNLGTREFIYSAAQQRWLMIGSNAN